MKKALQGQAFAGERDRSARCLLQVPNPRKQHHQALARWPRDGSAAVGGRRQDAGKDVVQRGDKIGVKGWVQLADFAL